MKKILLSFLMVGITALGYSQGETCETAEVITEGSFSADGPATGGGFINTCGLGGESVTNADWYSYTPTEDQSITVSSCLGGVDTRVSILSGTCDSFVCVGSNDDFCEMTAGSNSYASSVTVNVFAGTTYFIEWDDRWATDGFDWSLTTGDFIFPPACPELTFPANGMTDVAIGMPGDTLQFTWNADTTGGVPTGYQFWFGEDPTSLINLGTVPGGATTQTLTGVPYLTTLYWQLIPINSEGSAEGCEIFSFTTSQSPNDTDGDGVDDQFDCAPEDILVYAGAPCDDGDAATTFDEIQEDCSCQGTIVPDNFECASAILIEEGSFTVDTINGGNGIYNGCFATGGTDAVWYTIDVETTGFMTVSSCLGGSDTRLSIYSGTCDALICEGFNDDFCEMTPGGNGFASQVNIPIDSGTTYFIEWDNRWSNNSFDFSVMIATCNDLISDFTVVTDTTSAEITWSGNDNGTYTFEYGEAGFIPGSGTVVSGTITDTLSVSLVDLGINTTYDYYVQETCEGGDTTSVYMMSFITDALPPGNDFCSGAYSLVVGSECVIDTTNYPTNAGATDSGIEISCANFSGGDVWFSFVAPASGSVTIETSFAGGFNDSGMALFMGTCDSLTEISCDDDGGEGLFSMISANDLVEGQTYFVAVWEYGNNAFGNFGICAYETPETDCTEYTGGPWVDFNNTFGGAPVAEAGVCPVNALGFGVWANEAYTVDGFEQDVEYTFSMCDGPGAGSWDPEIVIMDTLFNVIEGPVLGCEITWTCAASGTYLIGINEAGVCGQESTNLSTDNGAPTLTCTGSDVDCSAYTGGPYIDFNDLFGGAPVAGDDGDCPVNSVGFGAWANELYSVDNFLTTETYTFSICENFDAGSWDAELTVFDSNMNIIEGPTAGCTISFTPPSDGTYLFGINEVGVCGPLSTNLQVDNGEPTLTCEGNVAVNEIENILNVSIFPNPTDDVINIKINGLNSSKTIVNIVSLQGKIIESNEYSFNNSIETLDVSSLARGIYMIEIINGNAITTKKVVIK